MTILSPEDCSACFVIMVAPDQKHATSKDAFLASAHCKRENLPPLFPDGSHRDRTRADGADELTPYDVSFFC